MTSAMQVIDIANEKERALIPLTEEIARILQEPASRRDPRQLGDSWAKLDRMRPEMRSIGNVLRKIKKPVRVRMRLCENSE